MGMLPVHDAMHFIQESRAARSLPSLNYRVSENCRRSLRRSKSRHAQNPSRFMRLSELHLNAALEELRIAFETESVKTSIAIGHL